RDRRQLGERLDVDRALEIDDFPDRLAPGAPAPLIEFRLRGAAEIERHGCALQAQQEPALLLADTHGLLIAAHVPGREPVAQPTLRLAGQLDVRLGQADLFVQLAKQRLLERLALAHTALRKLPAAPPGPPAEEHITRAV